MSKQGYKPTEADTMLSALAVRVAAQVANGLLGTQFIESGRKLAFAVTGRTYVLRRGKERIYTALRSESPRQNQRSLQRVMEIIQRIGERERGAEAFARDFLAALDEREERSAALFAAAAPAAAVA